MASAVIPALLTRMYAAKSLHGAVYHGADTVGISYVYPCPHDCPAGVGNILGGIGRSLLIDVAHNYPGAFLRKQDRCFPAQPATGTGYYRYLIFQSHQNEYLLGVGCRS